MTYRVAQRYQDQLPRIKKQIKTSHDYFKDNYDRFNDFIRFTFENSLNNDEVTLLQTLSKPQLEFNVIEAYLSRLLGEFSKQEPDIEVNAEDQMTADPLTIRVVEQHLRHVFMDQKNKHVRYQVYKDLLAGGFSTLKVTTSYASPMSMNQVINIDRCFDPTLCGYDNLARESHKGDGRFCFELYPKSKEDFEEEFPDIPLDKITFKRGLAGFNWSYINDSTEIVIVAEFYEKKFREEKIVQIRGNQGEPPKVIPYSKYQQMLDTWGDLAPPPAMIGKPRKTMRETICRYRVMENEVLEYEETDFELLPLIFVDGSSVMVKTPKNGNVKQVCRPYVYHAKGAQKLKNYAGISWANEIENTIQHKFMVAKEALPKEEEFLQAYKDVQKANVVVFNSVYEENPDQQIPNPIREISRNSMPQEISQAFVGADQLIQNVLGSYDAALGINNNQLSGIALIEAASQSNATAMPYIVGVLQGLQRAAQSYVNLMPKYITTPRTLPVMDQEGMRGYLKINQEGGFDMDFDTNPLNVVFKAGASFQVQKSRTIMMVKEMMGMSPIFAQFISDKGLPFILDNMEGRGIEQLKQMVNEWQKEMQQQKQMALQQQQQELMNNPAVLKAQVETQKIQHEAERDKKAFQIDMEKLAFEQRKLLADMQMSRDENKVQMIKANTERFAKAIEYSLKRHDMGHRHLREALETHHKISQPTYLRENV